VRLKWDATAFPRGMPVVTADVQGQLVYDPRDATTKFSNNPWLCIRDYLTSTRYGVKAASSMIDDTTFSAEANYADQAVSVPTSSGSTTQARYTCDGIVNIDAARSENLRGLLSSCRGFLVFSGGKYKAKSDKATTAETFTLTEDNIVGGWRFSLPQKRQRYNRVRANFPDADNQWQPNVAVVDSTAYRAVDGGTMLEGSVDLPFTKNVYTATQIAQQVLKQSRWGSR
jgi:predicted phage tail protein